MKKELAEWIRDYYPVFRNVAEKSPYEDSGFECGDGWYHILGRFGKNFTLLGLRGVKIAQIKERLGSLRITLKYPASLAEGERDRSEMTVIEAERQSYKTCEACGGHGSRRELGAKIMIRCDTCFKNEPRP
jgi:hypothetical protein